jgi:hypothetical protein
MPGAGQHAPTAGGHFPDQSKPDAAAAASDENILRIHTNILAQSRSADQKTTEPAKAGRLQRSRLCRHLCK